MRRIGVLLPASPDDPDYQTRVSALAQGLALLGWNIGRNIRIDIRWARGDPEQLRRYAEELVALGPDVLLASSSLAVAALQQATPTFQLCLEPSSILSEQGLLRACRTLAATQRASPISNIASAGNG